MEQIFELSKFDEYKEDNRREVKKANGGLPNSLWETYSSFANTDGGAIILGVKEEKDGSWKTTGLKKEDESKLLKNFWDTINNVTKVSVNILSEKDVETSYIGDDLIIVIYVPRARREDKPVYINDRIFEGSFRRNFEGDYHCTRAQVKAMLRDQSDESSDMQVVDRIPLSDLNQESIHGYRNSHRALRPGHPFERLSDEEYLRSIGAAQVSEKDGMLHPTAAGLLMFGNEYDIVIQYPEYFLDYREIMDTTTRWTDRVQSSSGEWSGNLFDFYFRVYNKIIKDLKVPFKMEGGVRIDDTPVHKAIREALANCLINADYYGTCGLVIKKEKDSLVLENPGYIRVGKKQMRLGGMSDPRNKALMKIFNLIDIGERAGSGIPNIFNVWKDEGWKEPVIEECFDPDRTKLSLAFSKQTIKTSDKKQAIKTSDKKLSKKTIENQDKIRKYLSTVEVASCADIAKLIDVGQDRTRVILKGMHDVKSTGENKNRKYSLEKKDF